MNRGRGVGFFAVVLVILLAAGLGLGGCGSPATTSLTQPPVSPTMATTTSTAPGSSTSTTSASSTTEAPTTTKKPTTTKPPTTSVPAGGKEYSVLPTEDKVVALTFDAAYEPAPLAGILAALEEVDAAGSFFLTGEFVEDFPAEVAAIRAAGYAIGSHSYSHPDFVELSDAQIREQLRLTEDLLDSAGVQDPRPLFRFPYGSRDERTLSLLGEEGYVSFFWTIDTLDWKPERTTDEIRQVILDKLRPGAIVLMHVGSPQTAEILPRILVDLAERGYRTVGLREALAAYGG